MTFTQKHAITVLAVLFLIDGVYLFGVINDVYSIIDRGMWWFGVACAGFAASYLMNKAAIEDKVAINIFITIGFLLNLVLIVFWLLFRNFDPIFL